MVQQEKYQLPVHQSISGQFNQANSPPASEIMLQYIALKKSLMAEWLEQEFQLHEMYCHDMEVMDSNHNQVEPGVRSTSGWTKKKKEKSNNTPKLMHGI